MFFGMHMHEDKSEADSIGPANLGDLDGERFIGSGKFDLQGKASAGVQRIFAYDMATLFRETRDQSASGDVIARKGQRNLYFIARGVAALHSCLCGIRSQPT